MLLPKKLIFINSSPGLSNKMLESLSELYNLHIIVDKPGNKLSIPDLIILDALNQDKRIISMLKEIKQNEMLQLVPILIIVNNSTLIFNQNGLSQPGLSYLFEPFTIQDLLKQTKHILDFRIKLLNLGVEKSVLSVNKKNYESYNLTLVKKVKKILEQSYNDPEFTSDILCNSIGISKSQLNRRLRKIVNKSIFEYINFFRIEKAANMIHQDYKTISEIAFEVGFNELRTFYRNFLKVYKLCPKQYRASFLKQKSRTG